MVAIPVPSHLQQIPYWHPLQMADPKFPLSTVI